MIVPISLEKEVEVIEKQVVLARGVGSKRFHVDILDGLFADNVTVSPADLQAIDLAGMELDLHLLVDDPTEWLPECVAIKPKRIYAQIEKMGNIDSYISTLKGFDKEIVVGLGVGIHTPIDSLSDEILGKVEAILLLSIEPGFGGTPFHPEVLPKIRELRARFDKEIFIDGGINPTTYQLVKKNGATEAGANSAMWKGDFEQNWKMFGEVE